MAAQKQLNIGTESGRVSHPDWTELVHECLVDIMFRLSLDDRWQGAMGVCKAWYQACKDPCLNSVLDVETQLGSITAELPQDWTPELEKRVDDMVRSVVSWSEGLMAEIRVRHCSDRSLSMVAQMCPNLRVLCIKSSPGVTDEVMDTIASACPKINELDISYCYGISHKSLVAIGSHCSNVRILKRNLLKPSDSSQHAGIVQNECLKAYLHDGDVEAAAIAEFMPQLVHLELGFSTLTGKGLALISERCPNLEYIDISGCANLSSRDIADAEKNLKKLKTINKPKLCNPRFSFQTERYDHWSLYDDRFIIDSFRI